MVDDGQQSVRVEVEEAATSSDSTPDAPGGPGRRVAKRAAGVLGVAALGGLLLFGLRPDSGTDAAGDTRQIVTTTTTTVPSPTSVSPVAEVSEAERLNFSEPIREVVRADPGLLALMFTENDRLPVLFRSISGREWTEVPVSLTPDPRSAIDSQRLAFFHDLIATEDGFALLASTEVSGTGFSESIFTVERWVSTNAVDWTFDQGIGTELSGGIIWPVSHGADHVVLARRGREARDGATAAIVSAQVRDKDLVPPGVLVTSFENDITMFSRNGFVGTLSAADLLDPERFDELAACVSSVFEAGGLGPDELEMVDLSGGSRFEVGERGAFISNIPPVVLEDGTTVFLDTASMFFGQPSSCDGFEGLPEVVPIPLVRVEVDGGAGRIGPDSEGLFDGEASAKLAFVGVAREVFVQIDDRLVAIDIDSGEPRELPNDVRIETQLTKVSDSTVVWVGGEEIGVTDLENEITVTTPLEGLVLETDYFSLVHASEAEVLIESNGQLYVAPVPSLDG